MDSYIDANLDELLKHLKSAVFHLNELNKELKNIEEHTPVMVKLEKDKKWNQEEYIKDFNKRFESGEFS